MQKNLPKLSTQNVVNKHRKANENIDKKKISNKQYDDAKKNTKTSKIKEGDSGTLLFVNRNQTTSYLQDSPPSDLRLWRGKAQQLRHEMADAASRVKTYFKVVKPVEKQSSDEEKSTAVEDVQDNRVGDDMQDFIE